MIWRPSPNADWRRGGANPDILVIHYTAMNTGIEAVDWLCSEEAGVSAHYVIDKDGTSWQLVEEHNRAWHAGAGAWGSVADVNSRSIGIELDNTGDAAFPEAQIAALLPLVESICRRWAIPPQRVIGHSDLAPARKIDPGRLFPWDRLVARGLAIAVEAAPAAAVDPDRFRADLAKAGYTAEAEFSDLLRIFRFRHRQGAEGPLDEADCGLAAALARAYPVDRSPALA